MKMRNRGSVGLQFFIMNMLGGRSEANALLSYQITSIGAGLLFLGLQMGVVRKLVQRNVERLLLVTAVSSGGFMLMFFGYVENYALFVISILAFCLAGLLASQGKLTRWWILLPLVVSALFHIFGCVLIPAAGYLMLSGTRLGKRLGSLSVMKKIVIGVVGLAVAGVPLYYFYATSYFFRFSLVPLVEDRFTVYGYTMFSFDHLLDIANLLLQLVPAIAMLLVVGRSDTRSESRARSNRFLLISAVCAVGAAIIFDPHLGMPRDWDLFSFCGLPLGTLLIWRVLGSRIQRSQIALVLTLSSLFMFHLLILRAGVLADESASIAMTENYINLDKGKTQSARFLILNYYAKAGRSDLVNSTLTKWQPDLEINNEYTRAKELAESGKPSPALPILREIVKVRPNFHEAWSYLGRCMGETGSYDSAFICISISNGINPYNQQNLYHLGLLYFRLKRYDLALQSFRSSSEIDTLYSPPLMGMVLALKEKGDNAAYRTLLRRITARPAPDPEFYQEYIESRIAAGEFDEARSLMKRRANQRA